MTAAIANARPAPCNDSAVVTATCGRPHSFQAKLQCQQLSLVFYLCQSLSLKNRHSCGMSAIRFACSPHDCCAHGRWAASFGAATASSASCARCGQEERGILLLAAATTAVVEFFEKRASLKGLFQESCDLQSNCTSQQLAAELQALRRSKLDLTKLRVL